MTLLKSPPVLFLLLVFFCLPGAAQVSYNAAAAYGLRKLIPTYSGPALQVRRTCDGGVSDIGFTSCGDLDTVALKAFVVAANPLSAVTVTAATAYSLRRLSCIYPGFAIRVRSTAIGSPTLDIGFTPNGDLDTAALKLFAGINNAFVAIWYDQSGNSRHAFQATAGSQPRIVNAGVIDRQGGRPAVYWPGMGCNLSTLAFTAYTAAACFNGVARVSSNVTYNTIVNKTTNNFPAPLDLYNAQVVIGSGPSYNFYSYGQTFNAALPLSVWTYQAAAAGSYNFYYNGGLTASGAVGAFGDGGNPLVLGSRADGMTGLNGWISEVITFNVLPSATDRQFIEWSQALYYSISGPALAGLPVAPASGYVSAWYDQSGNGNTAAQVMLTSQPGIVNAGVIEKNGAVPAINFAGFPQNLVAPLSTNVYPVSISVLGNTSGNTTSGAFVKLGTSLNTGQAGIGIGVGDAGGTFDNSGTSVIGVKEWSSWCPSNPNVNYPSTAFVSNLIQQSGSGGTSIYLNGTTVPLSNATATVGASITGNLFIGGYINITNRFPAVKQSEVIVFPTALSATRRTLLETQQSAYNSITVSSSKYTPPAAGYIRYVSGVGRESATDSVAGTRSTVGMGFIIGQTAADFLKDDGDYLTAGVSCPAAALSTLNLPGTLVQRWNNDWYVHKTDVSGNNGTITFYFDFSDYGFSTVPGPGTAGNYELLVRNSAAGTFSIVAGTTKTVVADRIQFAVDAASISTDSYYTIGTKSIGSSPLPVELTAFEASCSHAGVQVKWSAATQKNNAYFLVQRTANGMDYETVGRIKGAGTVSQAMSYAFTDALPLAGLSYYRLVQTDFDGAEKAFQLAEVNCGSAETVIKIYPNPNEGVFVVEGLPPFTSLKIYNALGATVFEQTAVLSPQAINLGSLPNGIYFVKAGNSPEALQKLVIQR